MDVTLYIVTFIFSLVVAGALVFPFLVEVSEGETDEVQDSRSDLLLKDLEHEFLTGKIDEKDYEEARRELGENDG